MRAAVTALGNWYHDTISHGVHRIMHWIQASVQGYMEDKVNRYEWSKVTENKKRYFF